MGSAGSISCWSDVHDDSNLVIAMQLTVERYFTRASHRT
jgi:hypothetical protein